LKKGNGGDFSLDVLDKMKALGHESSYAIAYSASIYALSKIERSENIPSSGKDKAMTTA
jgi:hypothetical protein